MELQLEDDHLRTIYQAATEAGSIQRTQQGTAVPTTKTGVADVVTETDRETEALIQERLTDAYPSYRVLSEERNADTSLEDGEYTWIIDPIDGTLNYAHGLPLYAVSIALYEGTTPVVGGIYAPELERFYYARRGEGAFCDERPISVSETETMDDCYLSTDITRRTDSHETLLPFFESVTRTGQGAIQVMSATLSLSFVAEGAVDATCMRGLGPWDFAAGALLVTEAGGTVSSYTGETEWSALEAGNIVAAPSGLHGPLLERYHTQAKNQ